MCWVAEPVSSETSKSERRSVGDHSSIRDSWPMAFSGYPRGPRVGCEIRCPKHAAPNLPAESRSRTRVSREPNGHRQRRSPDGADSLRDTQAVCGFRCQFHAAREAFEQFEAKFFLQILGKCAQSTA